MIRSPYTGFAAALAAGLLLLAPQAHAQTGPNNQPGFHPPYKDSHPLKTDDNSIGAPPPGLPGTLDTFAPAEKTQLDLPPTEALFDAINRGDLASARDAIARGADLNGRNILGLTPVDLSIDLSRNDITFLLLSIRSGETPSAATASPGKPPAVAAKPGTKPAAVAAAPKPVAPKVVAAKPAPVVLPRQFAGTADSGTPNPQAGFLGFGGTVQ